LSAYFQSGGLVDSVINLGFPAPIDIQVSGSNLQLAHRTATEFAEKIRRLPSVSDVLVPQDIDYPALRLDVNRQLASQLGLSSKEVLHNVTTALTSGGMIAPSYFVDPVTGNDYILTVQYPEGRVQRLEDMQAIPLRSTLSPNRATRRRQRDSPRQRAHRGEPLSTSSRHRCLCRAVPRGAGHRGTRGGSHLAETPLPEGIRVTLRGMVQGMNASFRSFGLGLILAVILVYLILAAQFESWLQPFLILLAVPAGLAGVTLTLCLTETTLNVMSLMAWLWSWASWSRTAS